MAVAVAESMQKEQQRFVEEKQQQLNNNITATTTLILRKRKESKPAKRPGQKQPPCRRTRLFILNWKTKIG